MKNIGKFMLVILGIMAVILLIVIIYLVIVWNNSNSIELEKSKLLSPFSNLKIYDSENQEIENIKSSYRGVNFDEINTKTIDAFTSIEDKRFFEHHGVDLYRVAGAVYNNIKSFSLKEGASTITQQLVKNTILTNEKTFDRKITEMFLSSKLEKEYSKNEILAMYLSAIYFGNGQYGIKNASNYYFDKNPTDLTVTESAMLAGMIKSPTKYCPITNYDNAVKRRNIVLRKMLENQKISFEDYTNGINEKTKVYKNQNKSSSFYNYVILEACDRLKIDETELLNGGFNIFTNFNEKYNNLLDDVAKQSEFPTTIVLYDNRTNSIVSTYESKTKNSLYKKDNPASLIKPILVYSVAVEENFASPLTIYDDSKTSFNGYSPSNYGDLYYSNVTMRKAIEKSLNIPAIKTFNAIPNKVLKKYGEKLKIAISDNENLTFAVGGIEGGMSLSQLLGAYATLANYGEYSAPSFITKIENLNGKKIYGKSSNSEKVFSEETSFIINDMLKTVAKTGTAKSLYKNYGLDNVSAKTGTNGTDNGNSCAYSVVYNDSYTLITKIEKDSSLLPNKIAGGTLPTEINGAIFSKLDYVDEKIDEEDFNLQKVEIDKYSLIYDRKILLASENTPPHYILTEYVASRFAPKRESTIFEQPEINNLEATEFDDEILIVFDGKDIYQYEITNSFNDNKIIINGDNGKISVSVKAFQGEDYFYEVTPILKSNEKIVGDKVCTKSFGNKYSLTP